MKFVAHVALAPRGADPRTPPVVRGTRQPLTGRVRAAGTPAHRELEALDSQSKLWTEGCWTPHRWTDWEIADLVSQI